MLREVKHAIVPGTTSTAPLGSHPYRRVIWRCDRRGFRPSRHDRGDVVHQLPITERVSLGLELLAAPMLGVVCGAVEGACLGAIWAYIGRRKYGMTIRGLMWIVAISGPGLAFVIAFPMVALFALANAAVALPFALMEAIAVTSAREET